MLLFIVFAPIVAAVLIFLGSPARMTALIASALTLAATLAGFAMYDPTLGGFQQPFTFPINSDLGLHFSLGADGLSWTMLLLAGLVTLCAVWFTHPVASGEKAFYACLLFISAGALGAFASVDLFFFYAFHELALVPTFLLIGIWGHESRRAAAWKITIYLALGSFVLLLGLILLYRSVPAASRTFDLRTIQTIAPAIIPAPEQRQIFLLLLLGFGTLISLFPFHTWAPEAYAAAPAPAAMLHAGVLKKFGLYGLLRVALPLVPEGARYWSGLLLVLLLGNIIYVGLVTIAQKRLDWMLGYSSVMHMGYIFLGIAAGNALGVSGAAVLMFAHGISIALLFGIAGEIRHRTGTLEFSYFGGLARVMPFAALAFGIGVFASIGLPGFANFPGEVSILFGAFSKGADLRGLHAFQIATLFALWGVVMSAVYMLRAHRGVFMGALPEQWSRLHDLRTTLRVPITLLVAASLVVGFFPQTIMRVVTPSARVSATSK